MLHKTVLKRQEAIFFSYSKSIIERIPRNIYEALHSFAKSVVRLLYATTSTLESPSYKDFIVAILSSREKQHLLFSLMPMAIITLSPIDKALSTNDW